jgi:hypothetical protein
MNFRPLTDAYRFSHSRKVSYDMIQFIQTPRNGLCTERATTTTTTTIIIIIIIIIILYKFVLAFSYLVD